MFLLVVLVGSIPASASAQPTESVQALSTPIVNALTDYSNYLSTGETTKSSLYTPQMSALVVDRRNFYQELFDVGLNVELVGLKSQFVTTSGFTDSVQNKTHQLVITENVTLSAISKISSPDDYPLVQSAKWAISNASDDITKQALEGYLQNMMDSVNESITNGSKIEFVLKHKLTIVVNNNQATIVQDSFDDKSIENIDGTDVVSWTDKGFIRAKPDFTQMPDYQFFHTPIEVLGKSLLESYNARTVQPLSGAPYNHTNGKTYINTYTSNTTRTCNNGITLQYTYYYNHSYAYFECNDCANFVSQALRYGGLPTSSTWQPYSTAWINTYSLRNYLQGLSGWFRWVSSLSNMQPGDLSWTSDWGHVVMYSGVNPARYSGHTNDRLLKNWDPSLTHFGVFY